MKKKTLSIILAIVMVIGMIPVTALPVFAGTTEFKGVTIDYENAGRKTAENGDLILSYKIVGKDGLTIPEGYQATADILVVGGGGSGSSGGKFGSKQGYGGYGGTVVMREDVVLTAGGYTVTVGDGGSAVTGASSRANGKPGQDSSVAGPDDFSITAAGGAGGGGSAVSGTGTTSEITGTSVTYGADGASRTSNVAATIGEANTGNGGSGGFSGASSGAGGSGVVVIRLKDIAATDTEYTVTNGTPESDSEKNHGYITIDKETAAEEDTVTVTVNPEDGYELKSLKSAPANPEVEFVLQTDGTYQFTMPAYAVTVTAEFEKLPKVEVIGDVICVLQPGGAPLADIYFKVKNNVGETNIVFDVAAYTKDRNGYFTDGDISANNGASFTQDVKQWYETAGTYDVHLVWYWKQNNPALDWNDIVVEVTARLEGEAPKTARVTLPAGIQGYSYVVSKVMVGEDVEILPVETVAGGATYELPVGAKIAISAVPADGYVISPVDPYIIGMVTESTTVDSANLPNPTVYKKVDIPTAATGLVYNGEEQTGVETGTGYTLEGNTATNAGEHTATATLADGCIWSDGTLDAKEISWSIAPAEMTVFTIAYEGFYDGEQHMPEYYVLNATDDVITDATVSIREKGTEEWIPAADFAPYKDCCDLTLEIRAEKANFETATAEVTLLIKPRIVVMHAKDGEWEYDETMHTQPEYFEDTDAENSKSMEKWGTEEALAGSTGFFGDEGFASDLVMTEESYITDVGTKANVIDQTAAKAALKENTNPDNYEIYYLDGTLEVTEAESAGAGEKEWFNNPFNSLCLGYYSSELVEAAIAGLDEITSADDIEQYKADYVSTLLKAREEAFKESPYTAMKAEIEELCKALGFDGDKTAEILSDFDEFISGEYNNETREEVIGAIAEKYGTAQNDAQREKAVRELYFTVLLAVNSNWIGESSANLDDIKGALIRSMILFDDNDKITEAIESGNLEVILMVLLECYPDYVNGYLMVAEFENDAIFDTVYATLRNAVKADKEAIELKKAVDDAKKAINAVVPADASAETKKIASDAIASLTLLKTVEDVNKAKNEAIEKTAFAYADDLANAKTAGIEEVRAAVPQDAEDEVKQVAQKAVEDIQNAKTVTAVNEIKSTAINKIKSLSGDICEYCGEEHKTFLDTIKCFILIIVRIILEVFKSEGKLDNL